MCIMFTDAVVHSVQRDFDVLSTTSVKSQGGADFFIIDSFVKAVAVCTLASWTFFFNKSCTGAAFMSRVL